MPVSMLICEGAPSSPDVRVLSKVLAGLCEVRPLGGKYGMGDRVLSRRETLGQTAVFGLLDGDYSKWQAPQDNPVPWLIQNDTVHLGWRWQRKEIENYLIDPVLVKRALGVMPDDYEAALSAAAERIATYQAARIALTLNRPRFTPLPNSFGKAHGRHRHPMPENFTRENCLSEVQQLVKDWNTGRTINEEGIEAAFTTAEEECSPEGVRRRNFLVSFAGKDLLCSMNDHLKEKGFNSSAVFIERVLTKLEESTEVWEWLPEWKTLRKIVADMP